MNTLIVYASKYGSAEKCAESLAQKLTGKVDRCNAKQDKALPLSQYDKVIVGGSIYMGQIQKEIREFCTRHADELKTKKIGLFICCMQGGDTAAAQLNASFPGELISSAAAVEWFPGDLIFSKMKAFDRFIAKMVSKSDKDLLNFSEERVDGFARKMNNA